MSNTTREKVLVLLRKQPRTLAELAAELKLTRNAIVSQTNKLSADGLICRGARRHSGSAGKPAFEFEVIAGSEDHASQAYLPLVQGLLAVMRKKMPGKKLPDALRQAGLEIARSAGLPIRGTLNERVQAALNIVNSLGAAAELTRHSDGRPMVRNVACPFASAVRDEPCVCAAAAAFFEQATGRHVEEACLREEQLTCRYIIGKKRSSAAA